MSEIGPSPPKLPVEFSRVPLNPANDLIETFFEPLKSGRERLGGTGHQVKSHRIREPGAFFHMPRLTFFRKSRSHHGSRAFRKRLSNSI